MPNLPCPFCGSNTADVRWRDGICEIACGLCGARAGALEIDEFGTARAEAMEKAAKRAWELWNERLPAAPVGAAGRRDEIEITREMIAPLFDVELLTSDSTEERMRTIAVIVATVLNGAAKTRSDDMTPKT